MSDSRICSAVFAAFAASAVFAFSQSANAAFVLNEISIAGATQSAIWDINNSGTMVGWSIGATPNVSTAFVRSSDGTVTPLAGPAGAATSAARGISDGGIVVGEFSGAPGGPYRGFIFSGGSYTIFSIAGSENTFVRGISPDGRYLSGYYTTATHSGTGYVYDSINGLLELTSIAGSLETIAQGVTNAGVVVGSDKLAGVPPTYPGFIYDEATNTRTDGTLPGATRTAIRAIDEVGTLAGFFEDGSGLRHGFVGSLTSYEQIDFLGASHTEVEGSNDAGVLVGQWFDAQGLSHGFIGERKALPEPTTVSLITLMLGMFTGFAHLKNRCRRS